MRAIIEIVVCVAMASACSSSGDPIRRGAGDPVVNDDEGCPDEAPPSRSACSDPGLSCDYDPATRCTCNVDVWFCQSNTCPAGIPGGEPVACSTSDAGCEYSDWEHDCSCGCIDTPTGLYWSCFGDTIGSVCPRPPS